MSSRASPPPPETGSAAALPRPRLHRSGPGTPSAPADKAEVRLPAWTFQTSPTGALEVLAAERERREYDECDREQDRCQHGPQHGRVLASGERSGLGCERSR